MKLPGIVRLYTARLAPNPLKVEVALAEKGVSVPVIDMNLEKKEPYSAAHLMRTNGQPVVPVVELEDGTCLSESFAITRYIDALYPVTPLHGADPLEAALIDQWCRRVEFGLGGAVRAVFRHTHPKMAEREHQVPEWGEANIEHVERELDQLDARLREVEYITGGGYSIADIGAYITLRFMRVARFEPQPRQRGLIRYMERIADRDAIRAAYSRPPA